ncbi:hypothetical protein [Methylobacterium sp. SD21]|uniref:hypothetical protein n=1 Tax=Methylobacterium litchii TaxID=3138810 RepID=UPI00313B7932
MSAQIIPFPEPALRAPCADPAACLSFAEVQVGDVLTAVCPRCGMVGVLDATLAELDAAIEAQEALS